MAKGKMNRRVIKMERYGKSFKELDKKEKVKFIWEYYRWIILSVIIGIVVITQLVAAMLTPKEVNDVDILIAAKLGYDETQPQVVSEYKENFNTGLDLTAIDWENMNQMDMVMLEKIPLLVTAKELDVLGLSGEAFESYVRQLGPDMFIPLDTLPEFEDLLEKYKDRAVISGYELDEDEQLIRIDDHVYGIRSTKFKNIPCIVENEEVILGVTASVKDLEKTAQVLDYLLEE